MPIVAEAPLRCAPDFADYSVEVCAQDFLDHRRGLSAFGEFSGDDLHVIGSVEVGHVGIAILAGGPDPFPNTVSSRPSFVEHSHTNDQVGRQTRNRAASK